MQEPPNLPAPKAAVDTQEATSEYIRFQLDPCKPFQFQFSGYSNILYDHDCFNSKLISVPIAEGFHSGKSEDNSGSQAAVGFRGDVDFFACQRVTH